MEGRPEPAGRIAAVVLAAGAASRFGAPKQRLLLPRVLERLEASALADVVVVAGAHDLEPPPPARLVVAFDWERGPGASLRAGLSALARDVVAAVVVLADGPLLAPAAVFRVIDAWRSRPGDVIAASYGGNRGHPLVVGRSAWSSVPDEGLRGLPIVLVPCDDVGAPGDVDTPADLDALGL
jgi:CTP:molybdopterin cytidylyltransferase MocA